MIIEIAHEVSEQKLKQIKDLLWEAVCYEPWLNGVEVELKRSDFTCIPDDNSADACRLLGEINTIIRGES